MFFSHAFLTQLTQEKLNLATTCQQPQPCNGLFNEFVEGFTILIIRGNQDKIITDYIAQYPSATIKIYKPDLLTPIILELDSHAALVGPDNPKVYSKLISFDSDNKYKMYVRNITENDLL